MISVIVLFSFYLFFFCGDELSPNISLSFYQIPGCQSSPAPSLNKNFSDSCFSYSFLDKLKIDFCMPGNCCPDENRFLVTSSFSKDSIFINVIDTAENRCRCNCSYIIHGEFESLTYDSYVIVCTNKHDGNILYSELVKRKFANE